ncbi:MAG: Gldg family protein, partial [Lachnospiraceae bacterium]|nr:Gldg family protein [Lachnospiraceae bacterium]
MLAIFKKECRSYLYSVTGALFVSINLLILGLYFMANNLVGMSASLAPVMINVLFILLIMVPVLTMRSLAEERKLRTDQLLLTYPVSVFRIIAGKYLALLAVFALPVAVSCLYPIVLSSYGDVAYAESYASILGYFLFGAACLSIGLFISSITESQVIAAVLTFAALFLTYLMGGIVSLLTSGGNKAAEILNIFDFPGRLENIMSGILDLKDIFYFLSVTALMLFLTCQSLLKRRFTVSKKTIKLSVYSNALIIIVIAAVVAANFGMSKIPARYTEFDLTEDGKFTLSQESVDYIKALDEDITIYCIGTEDMMNGYDYKEVTYTLGQYDELSDRIKVVYKDPSKEPDFTAQFSDDNVEVGSLIVTAGDKSKVISSYEMFETEVDYQNYTQNKTAYDGEGQITSAIAYVTTDDIPKVYVITGHGEKTLGSYARLNAAVKKQNLDVEELNLMNVDKIPEDAGAVMMMGPTVDLSADDAGKVSAYLKSGGNLVAAVGYTEEETPNLDKIFSEYKVTRLNGIVFEGDADYMYQTPLYLLPEVESSAITSEIKNRKMLCLVPESAAFLSEDSGEDDGEDNGIEMALTSSDKSYLKKNIDETTGYEKSSGDQDGPFDIAAYISVSSESGKDTNIAL